MTKKSKYNQIIDADVIDSGILKRMQEKTIPDDFPLKDIEVASRDPKITCLPRTSRMSDQIRKNVESLSTPEATERFKACGGNMIIKELGSFTKTNAVEYRNSNKTKKHTRRK